MAENDKNKKRNPINEIKGVTPDIIKRGEQAKAGATALRKGISTAPSVLSGYKASGITGGRGAPPVVAPAATTVAPVAMKKQTGAAFPDRTMANRFSDMVSRVESGRQYGPSQASTADPMNKQFNWRVGDLKPPVTEFKAGPYDVTNSTLSASERERFMRKPTSPGTQMVRTGRPEGGWSPDYGRGDTSEQMPKFDAPGFEGKAKESRIYSQEQRWLRERRGAADKTALLSTAEAGETARQRIQQDASDLRAAASGQLATEAERTRVSEKDIAAKQSILKSRFGTTMKGYDEGAKYIERKDGNKTRESQEEYLRRIDPDVANEYYGKKAKVGSVGSYVSAIE